MGLDQETIDRITLAAASEILDNAQDHMARWKAERDKQRLTGPVTGSAPAGELGTDIFVALSDLLVHVWNWCIANRDNLFSSAVISATFLGVDKMIAGSRKTPENITSEQLERLAQQVTASIEQKIIDLKQEVAATRHAALNEEEIAAIAHVMAPLIAQELAERNKPPSRSADGNP